jgi:uncharacterized damage-inducible protein DinB
VTFPEPTIPASSRTEVFLRYLDYFRDRVINKTEGLADRELRRSRLPSGWTPLELLKHLTFVELRWIEWGFAGHEVADPFGDARNDRWYVAPDETRETLVAALRAQAARTRAVIDATDLAQTARPGLAWEGEVPPPLERILFHLVQEYARHLGQLDIVVELADGTVGELAHSGRPMSSRRTSGVVVVGGGRQGSGRRTPGRQARQPAPQKNGPAVGRTSMRQPSRTSRRSRSAGRSGTLTIR